MGMILLRRRFNYASRPRPNALAIVDPATNQVLYPGIAKIEKSAEKEFAVGDGDAKVSNVFQSHEQQQPQQQQQIFVEFPADRKLSNPKLASYITLHRLTIFPENIIVPDYQYPTFMLASFDPNNNDQTSFQHPIKYHDLPYMNEGRNQ